MGQTLSEPVVDKVIRTLHHPAPAPAVCCLLSAVFRLPTAACRPRRLCAGSPKEF
jgi:hypothetical protein